MMRSGVGQVLVANEDRPVLPGLKRRVGPARRERGQPVLETRRSHREHRDGDDGTGTTLVRNVRPRDSCIRARIAMPIAVATTAPRLPVRTSPGTSTNRHGTTGAAGGKR